MIFGSSYLVKLIYAILLYHLRILLKHVPLVCPPQTTNWQRNSPEDNESLQVFSPHYRRSVSWHFDCNPYTLM